MVDNQRPIQFSTPNKLNPLAAELRNAAGLLLNQKSNWIINIIISNSDIWPPNQPNQPHTSSPSPSNGVANGFSWTSQAFQLAFHLGYLSFRATDTKHTWKDGELLMAWGRGGSWERWGLCFLFRGLMLYLLGLDSFLGIFKSCCWEVGGPKMCSQWMRVLKNRVMSCVPDMSGIRSTWRWRINVKGLNVRTAQEKNMWAFQRFCWEKVAWYNQTEKVC